MFDIHISGMPICNSIAHIEDALAVSRDESARRGVSVEVYRVSDGKLMATSSPFNEASLFFTFRAEPIKFPDLVGEFK